ncbi:unnamed protein product [Arctogadus glacialis]
MGWDRCPSPALSPWAEGSEAMGRALAGSGWHSSDPLPAAAPHGPPRQPTRPTADACQAAEPTGVAGEKPVPHLGSIQRAVLLEKF